MARIVGTNSADRLIGTNSSDLLEGRGGADKLFGRGSRDFLSGGQGDAVDVIFGGSGEDYTAGGGGPDYIEGGNQRDALGGGGSDDTIYGGGGSDFGAAFTIRIAGVQSVPGLFGGKGDDFLYGGNGRDALLGGVGDDTIYGGGGSDSGAASGELLYREPGLSGGKGDDLLDGGGGADFLEGGLGTDRLRGGADDDVFRFNDGHSGKGKLRDVILDFRKGDVIDVQAIDAILGGSDDPFQFIGNEGFHGTAGELRFAGGKLAGDLDGDGAADVASSGLIDVAEAGPARKAGGGSASLTDPLTRSLPPSEARLTPCEKNLIPGLQSTLTLPIVPSCRGAASWYRRRSSREVIGARAGGILGRVTLTQVRPPSRGAVRETCWHYDRLCVRGAP